MDYVKKVSFENILFVFRVFSALISELSKYKL